MGINNIRNLLPHDRPVKEGGPVAEPTAAQRRMFAKMKLAMPDGSYYIREGAVGAADLDNAIRAVGQTTSASGDAAAAAVRRHIMTRAKALGLSDRIPDTWNSDGTLKHADWIAEVEEYLKHFGVKGMKWGVRRYSSGGSSSGAGIGGHHVSGDAARAIELRSRVSMHGVRSLSNQELQHLVTRLNLEQQHGRLNPADITAGRRVVNEILKIGGDVTKQQATIFAAKYAAKGIEALIKKSAK